MSISRESSSEGDLRRLIHGFIEGRKQAKLDKLKPEEGDKRAAIEAAHDPDAWLEDAARRVRQIQLASHILKPIHPDARGTSLYVEPQPVGVAGLVGTHSLGKKRKSDVVGNAAALDVYKFLSLEHDNRSLLERALDADRALIDALSDDMKRAVAWCQAFASLRESNGALASNTLAKQVYFPLPGGAYHLLAPLFPTTLVHTAWRTMRDDRYGDAAKAAREARSKGQPFEHGFREYPGLAIQNFGGTKPQNISQLNSERYGENWLLPSLPPQWASSSVRPPLRAQSVFDSSFGRQKAVKDLTGRLRSFLEKTSAINNVGIRQYRAALVQDICDETHQYAAKLRQLPAGWSADAACELHEAERLWLDPFRGHQDEEFARKRRAENWSEVVSHRFANWLNSAIASKKLPMGADEHAQWKSDLSSELAMLKTELEADRDEP